MGLMALNTWGFYTKYQDPSPFFASLDVYYDVVGSLRHLIKLEEL